MADLDGPSFHALRQMTTRNNLAHLKLRKTLQQFDREKSFSIAHLDRDKLDTRDFLRSVRTCDSDSLPQSREFLGSPSVRRRRTHTARTAPGRIGDSADSDPDSEDEDPDWYSVPSRRLLASRPSDNNPRILLTDYQRAERFLRRLRDQVAIEELHSRFSESDPHDFLAAVMTRMHRQPTPSLTALSACAPAGHCTIPQAKETGKGEEKVDETKGRMDLVYPIRTLLPSAKGVRSPPPPATRSPSLGPGSPRVRATPLGLPGGGSLGPSHRLQRISSSMMRFTSKPLEQRVKDFCSELDEIRLRSQCSASTRSSVPGS